VHEAAPPPPETAEFPVRLQLIKVHPPAPPPSWAEFPVRVQLIKMLDCAPPPKLLEITQLIILPELMAGYPMTFLLFPTIRQLVTTESRV
jgi:hypothetical protein